jgi:hypothetical protein
MPLTSTNIFLFIIFTFLVINMHLSRIFTLWVYPLRWLMAEG